MNNYVEVAPQELTFKFELRKNIPVALMLTNTTGDRVAFKVKTTSPKKYCVRPSSGIIEPKGVKEVQVIMQPQRELPPTFGDCKDKFLVQCTKVDDDASEASPDMFDASKARDIRQTKLRVVLVAPARPPSPVPEGSESEPASPAQTFRASGPPGATSRDKADIAQRLATLQQGGAIGRPGGAKQVARSAARYGLLSLLLVAVLAFLAGYFAQTALPQLPALSVLLASAFEKLNELKEQLVKKHG